MAHSKLTAQGQVWVPVTSRCLRVVPVLGLLGLLAWGCERGGASRATGPTGPTVGAAAATQPASQTVTADLRNRFLFEHNAQFNGGRTFRWVAPIQTHFSSREALLNDFFATQFAAWEAALAGAGGAPLYQVRPMARRTPSQGIFFTLLDLPGDTVGIGDPFSPLAQARRSPLIESLRQHVMPATRGRLEMPELQADGRIRRCVILLDLDAIPDDLAFAAVVRHEIGHCLGFIGHVGNPASLMHATSCCPLTITSDVTGMMRTLYSLPPNTVVTR